MQLVYFFAGWMASMAMLLPGISGSFILLIIGVYPTAINALTTLNLPLIVVIGAGVMVGFVVSSKGISFLLDRYKSMTFAAIIGLVIGSIVIVFPGIPTGGFFNYKFNHYLYFRICDCYLFR